MNLSLIGLDTVKNMLGIADLSYDTQITAMIPIVSADIRRILNTSYDNYIAAGYTAGSDELNIFNPAPASLRKTYGEPVDLRMGQVVTGDEIPDDTYIISMNPDTAIYTMSANATGAGDYVYPTLTIAQWPTVAKMIYYRISKMTISSASEKGLSSKSIGPISVSYSNSEINKKYNYPQILIDDLGTPFQEVG